MTRQADGSFMQIEWEEALTTAAEKLSSVRGEEIQGMIGQF